MEEKRLMAGLVEPTVERRPYASSTVRRRLRLRFGYVAALILIGLTVVMFLQPEPLLEVSTWSPLATKELVWQAKTPISKLDPKPDASRPVHTSGRLVPLEAHIMSKCPDALIYLGFTLCISREYDRIPDRELIEGCALEHAVDFAALNECATRDDGQYAMNLLRDSVQHTAAAGVTKSCTVRLDSKIYCIRDDGEWKDCPSGPGVHDLIVNVEKLYRRN
ncbi:hypothetical protein SPBR_07539 [Sporothrix brasiliensis 5110]|uniref:Gamma interferon inducible lysosomal thiol reductase n=1 Tax=Sporothrix brasiliensis 5110 TaxID=1398154 RepID=A0A0C2IPN8_9PEZI|nr:uncharacterized protein SPBR_07539 [Sporothrix brasiliensis 5110]KIH88900.1 hypothetical protein SPBR_07539 [Sporothrix brasiliensis 5110]